MGALQNKRLSSAKNKWVSFGPLRQIDTPYLSPLSIAFESYGASLLSIARIDREIMDLLGVYHDLA